MFGEDAVKVLLVGVAGFWAMWDIFKLVFFKRVLAWLMRISVGLFDQPADVGGIPVKMIGNLREAQGFVKILVDKGFYLIDKDVVRLIVHAGGLLINAVQPG